MLGDVESQCSFVHQASDATHSKRPICVHSREELGVSRGLPRIVDGCQLQCHGNSDSSAPMGDPTACRQRVPLAQYPRILNGIQDYGRLEIDTSNEVSHVSAKR